MKKLLIACSLLFSAHAFSAVKVEKTLNVGQKGFEYHSYYFGYVGVYSRSSVTYTVTNTGGTPLRFINARIYDNGFSSYHNCHSGLFPGQRCQFVILFDPTFPGYYLGNYYLTFDQGNEINVNVSGTGIIF